MLTAGERERVERAISAAERKTSGELVVVLARSADRYRFTALLWPAALAMALPLPVIVLRPDWSATTVYLLQLAVAVLAQCLMLVPRFRLALVPLRRRREEAREMAREQFYLRGLHLTRGRTGVLLAVAVGERYAEILADDGIDRRVSAERWQAILADLLAAARARRIADGLVAAILAIGDELAAHAPAAVDDRNELPDRLIIL